MNLFEKIAQEAMIDELKKVAAEGGIKEKIKATVSSGKAALVPHVNSAKTDASALAGLVANKNYGPSFGAAPYTAKERIVPALKHLGGLGKNPVVLGGLAASGAAGYGLKKALTKKQTVAQKLLALAAKNKIGLGIGAGAAGLAGLGAFALND